LKVSQRQVQVGQEVTPKAVKKLSTVCLRRVSGVSPVRLARALLPVPTAAQSLLPPVDQGALVAGPSNAQHPAAIIGN
jgi:hypothetical protein